MKNYYVFEYLYRDADNFKAYGYILLSGNVSDDFVSEIESYLYSYELFVAEQVNIPTLYSELWKYSNGPTNADHTFHEFSSIRVATEQEIESLDLWGETSNLLDAFRLAKQHSWDCSQSVHCAEFCVEDAVS